jgi:hypothetical protein
MSRSRDFALRFGNGVVSMPLWVRLAVTAPFVLLGIGLVQSFVHFALAGDPQAAFSLLLLGLLARFAWLLLPPCWQSTAEWEHADQRSSRVERQLKDGLDDTVRNHPNFGPPDPK